VSAPAVGPAAPATRRRRPDPSVSQAATVNSVAFVVSVALSFFITPFIIRTLGDARYGTWSLIAQVTGYYGLLDFGVRHAVAYYAASLLATEDDEDVSRLVSSAFWGLTGVALLVLALGAVLMTYFPTWFETAGVESGEIRGAIVIVSMTIALTLPFDVFGAVVNGCRRPDILSGLDVVLRIVTSGLIVLVLYQGGGLVALAGVQFGGKIATWLILSIVARHYVPALSLNPRLFGREWLRKVVSYGSRNFVINVSLAVIHRLDYVLIGTFLGVRFVTFYSIGKMMTGYVSTACSNVTRAFTMHFAHHAARNETERLRELYLTGARISGVFSALLTGYVLAFGSPFVRLWLGPNYVEGPWTERTDVVLAILLIGQAPRLFQSISWQLLFGIRRVNFLMWLQVGEAITNLLLSLALVRPLGLAGVALGTFLPLLVSNLVLLPRYVLREIDLPRSEYFRRGIGRPIVVASVTTVMSVALVALVPIHGWLSFVALATVAAIVGGALTYAFVLTGGERLVVRQRVPFLRPS
jgi:O-antigen/teichoic acid export membrane protein